MGLNQGYNRIISGFVKKVTKSEKDRGYLFVTQDKKALKLLRPNIKINFEGTILKKTIDDYGRISLGKQILEKASDKVSIVYKNKELIIKNIL